MSFPIRFLDLNFLMIVCFPSIGFLMRKGDDKENFSSLFCTNCFFAIFFAYFMYDLSFSELFAFKNLGNVIFSIFISSLLCLSFDFGLFYLKYKKIKITLISRKSTGLFLFVIILIPVMEELLFRVILKTVLFQFTENNIIYILLSSFAFSMNHLIYPKINVFTKFLWGIILSSAYLLTSNFIVPLMSHLLNNIVIYCVGYHMKERV